MSEIARLRLTVSGIVQGVGFRPFLHRLANRLGLCGWVRNTAAGVELELEGSEDALQAFQRTLRDSPPPLAVIEEIRCEALDGTRGDTTFSILPSEAGEGATLVSPDLAPCPACLSELTDPHDRRHRYPFLNCTDCGPRFSILRDLPYDRSRTSMAAFPMCSDCAAEYGDLTSRRYHAQPDCCPVCGPRAWFCEADGAELPGDAVALAQQSLAAGKLVAVKGSGGIHLACDARNQEAVRRLRERKHRPGKPLAVMCRDTETARRFCRISAEEQSLLESPRRPIVLLKKHHPDDFPEWSATGTIGVFLPYTPLHVLLLDGSAGGPDTLIFTSANRPGEPVLIENEDAVEALAGIADGYLLHDRPIVNRCDDSVLRLWRGSPVFFRRSRGYAPQPVLLPFDATGVIAFGAEQKASFAAGRERHAFLSQHIGDLKNAAVLDHYHSALETYLRLFRIRPTVLVCDRHPDYFSAREAQETAERFSLPLLRVQHHWAHLCACLADNRFSGPAFGIVWDGTGLGTDGSIWGGEFLTGGFDGFVRMGSLRPVLLPGGDAAVREIGRIALSLLWDAGLSPENAPLPPAKRTALTAMLEKGIACPAASSIGRLFDGVYSLLTGTPSVSYEGEGAVLLEAMLRPDVPGTPYPLAFYEEDGVRRFDFRPMLRALVRDRDAGLPLAAIARSFHETLCDLALAQYRALNPDRLPVALSGGVFLNQALLDGITDRLTAAGYPVLTHRRVSPGDEGLCLGQLAIAAWKRRNNHVFGSSTENPIH
ncbi:carbamoyltransferase HypF [Anaeromassilibacillus sp. An200]|uniref:carbamoyltransferase HypF n=1 Tax=Anaeromassilibacillus sp. An200 TaxID=1965587 RepID=UPI000B37A80E|nr:carbamoyltransferase HypF [Anaeromassilibacillus sp. An200]OUP12497.1 carbamoyltransferase HypF [Anaeromassilibacillus sp. An200]